MKEIDFLREEIRKHEDEFLNVFCTSFDFSDAFIKYEDDLIPLMWDHHRFTAKTGQICGQDIKGAVRYQKEQGCNYLQINSRVPLPRQLTETFQLQEAVTITMVKPGERDSLPPSFHVNPQVVIKDIQTHQIEQDLLAIQLKNYQEVYGGDFIKQLVSAFARKAREDKRLHYLGAYLNDKICGYCYYFDDGRYKVLDGLTVNEETRYQYVASSLIAYVFAASDSLMYLHADRDDTPRQMYQKMGFEAMDTLFEYTCTELGGL